MASTPRRPRFSPGLSQEELVRGYKRVGSRAPFTKAHIAKALKPYGLKPSKKRRRDPELAKIAARAVVKKFKATKAKK